MKSLLHLYDGQTKRRPESAEMNNGYYSSFTERTNSVHAWSLVRRPWLAYP